MIENLTIKNFKCFRNLSLPLSPLTLLAGLNGMGKSSVIQALLLLRQSYQSGALLNNHIDLSGELIELGTGQDVLMEGADEDVISFEIQNTGLHNRNIVFKINYSRGSDRLDVVEPFFGLGLGEPHLPSFGAPFAGEFQYLCAERVGPRKSLPLAEWRARKKDIGSKGEFVLHYLIEWGKDDLVEGDARIHSSAGGYSLKQQVEAWLQEISPGAILNIDPIRAIDAASASYSFRRSGDIPTRAFRSTNVGFGLSVVLPVIVALLDAGPDSLVLIENPEAHLHPQGQTRLGQLAARAAASGAQIVVESHSDHFMDGVRIDIRNGVLSNKKTSFHYFQKDGFETAVVSPEISSEGRLSEWPAGFFDQRDHNLAALLAPKR